MSIDEKRRRRAVRSQRWVLRISRNWLKGLIIGLAIFVGLPFLAPTLMYVGATGPADAIYTIYSPMCHQFAFRSWFLFGEQIVYPREAAGVEWLTPYEVYASQDPLFLNAFPDPENDLRQWSVLLMTTGRVFRGNAQMGYKVAVCQRDVAIYGGLLIGALLFAIPHVRLRLRPLPLLLFFFLGLGPVGLDGFSQLLSYANFWPIRETTPFLRTLTGLLFGLMNAWLALPYLELSMREAREEILVKFRRIGEEA